MLSIARLLEIRVENNGLIMKLRNAPVVDWMLKILEPGADRRLGRQEHSFCISTETGATISMRLHCTNSWLDHSYSLPAFLAQILLTLFQFDLPYEKAHRCLMHLLEAFSMLPESGCLHGFRSDGGQGVLNGHSDNNWGQEKLNCKPLRSNVVVCAGTHIKCSYKQKWGMLLSSKEAEYVSLASCVQDALWFMKLGMILSKVLDNMADQISFHVLMGEKN